MAENECKREFEAWKKRMERWPPYKETDTDTLLWIAWIASWESSRLHPGLSKRERLDVIDAGIQRLKDQLDAHRGQKDLEAAFNTMVEALGMQGKVKLFDLGEGSVPSPRKMVEPTVYYYECPICEMEFNDSFACQRHIQTHRKKED